MNGNIIAYKLAAGILAVGCGLLASIITYYSLGLLTDAVIFYLKHFQILQIGGLNNGNILRSC